MPWVQLNKFIEDSHGFSRLAQLSGAYSLQVQCFAALRRLSRQQSQRLVVVTGFDGLSY
jgi:hypothetical protein